MCIQNMYKIDSEVLPNLSLKYIQIYSNVLTNLHSEYTQNILKYIGQLVFRICLNILTNLFSEYIQIYSDVFTTMHSEYILAYSNIMAN